MANSPEEHAEPVSGTHSSSREQTTASHSRSHDAKQQHHQIPKDAFDCHVHVFDIELGPYSPTRAYTPGYAPFGELLSFNSSVSASGYPTNLVLVQPSPYGTENGALLSILRRSQLEGLSLRGIAVVDLDVVTTEELQNMHDLGVRGLRLNLQASGHDVDMEALKETLNKATRRIAHLPGWKLQIFAPAHVWKDLFDLFDNCPAVIIADHTGGLLAASKLSREFQDSPTTQPGFDALLELAKRSRVLIKISGLYRSSNDTAGNFADMAPLVRELARRVPDRLIWGSDWPHTGEGKDRLKNRSLDLVELFRVIDNKAILTHLRDWVGSEETWTKMMVENPKSAFT